MHTPLLCPAESFSASLQEHSDVSARLIACGCVLLCLLAQWRSWARLDLLLLLLLEIPLERQKWLRVLFPRWRSALLELCCSLRAAQNDR
jgi:hypothetical protein